MNNNGSKIHRETSMRPERRYYIYMLVDQKRTRLYTGVTNSLVRRLIEHSHGIGSAFTREHHVRHLLYYEEYQHPLEAIAREKQIKRWGRQKKIDLIKRKNCKFKSLNQIIFDSYGLSKADIQEIVAGLRRKYDQVSR